MSLFFFPFYWATFRLCTFLFNDPSMKTQSSVSTALYSEFVVSLISQKCGSSRKLVILLLVSSCYCFGAKDIVSVCSIVLSKLSFHACETLRELVPYLPDLNFAVFSLQEPYTNPLASISCWHVHCEECWLRTLVSYHRNVYTPLYSSFARLLLEYASSMH